jgi:hypothetical protein
VVSGAVPSAGAPLECNDKPLESVEESVASAGVQKQLPQYLLKQLLENLKLLKKRNPFVLRKPKPLCIKCLINYQNVKNKSKN